MNKKDVLVRVCFKHTLSVPEDWMDEQINFWLQESSFCLGNIIEAEAKEIQHSPGYCNFCYRAEATYIMDSPSTE